MYLIINCTFIKCKIYITYKNFLNLYKFMSYIVHNLFTGHLLLYTTNKNNCFSLETDKFNNILYEMNYLLTLLYKFL